MSISTKHTSKKALEYQAKCFKAQRETSKEWAAVYKRNGLMNHVMQESDGTIHFTFKAQPDNKEGDHFGRGWNKKR